MPKIVDKELRRREVLTAAARVFGRCGYASATIDQIALEAGVAKGSVYLSFDTKEDLFYALFEDVLRSAMRVADAADERDARTQLTSIILDVVKTMEQNELVIPLTIEFWSACGLPGTRARFGARYVALAGAFQQRLVRILKQGQHKGEIARDAPVDAVAASLIAITDGLLIQCWTDPRVRASALARKAVPYLLRSLAPP